MPDREKAIKGLEETEIMLTQAVDRGGEMAVMGAFKCLNSVTDALALLKEQEAVKPRECQYPYGTYACGFCDYIPIGNKDGYRANYCPECGKAVKWDADA